MSELPNKNIAIVMLGGHGIGGAEKRFTNFFLYCKKNESVFKLILILSREKYQALAVQVPQLTKEKTVIILNPSTKNNTRNIFKKLRNTIKYIFTNYKGLSLIAFPVFLIINTRRLKRILKKKNINLFHGVWDGLTECALIKKQNPNSKFLISYVELTGKFLNNRFYQNNPSFLPWVIKKADAVEVQSNPYLNVLKKKVFIPPNKPVFIAPCAFSNYEKAFSANKENIVVFLARLDQHKNPLLFLEAAKILLSKRKDIMFEVYGKGVLKNKIENYIELNSLKKFVKLDYTANSFNVFSKSKIFCSLNSYGSFPEQSTLEALSCENALITTDIEGSAGFCKPDFALKTSFCPKDIAAKIEYLIDNPNVCNKMAQAGKHHVKKNHRIELFSKHLLSVYNHILNL